MRTDKLTLKLKSLRIQKVKDLSLIDLRLTTYDMTYD